MVIDCPFGDVNASGVAGQIAWGPSGYGSTGGVGVVGEDEQADTSSASHTTWGKRFSKIS
jgi:hypothetical protein